MYCKTPNGEIFISNSGIRRGCLSVTFENFRKLKATLFSTQYFIGYRISRGMCALGMTSLFNENACAIRCVAGKQTWRKSWRPKDRKICIKLKQHEGVVVNLAVEKAILLPTVVTTEAIQSPMIEKYSIFNVDSSVHVRDLCSSGSAAGRQNNCEETSK